MTFYEAIKKNEMKHIQVKENPVSVPLAKVPANSRGIVHTILGNTTCIAKLIGLGVTPGAEVVIFRNHHRGPLIISLRDSSIAIGRREAANILVEV